MQPKRTCSVQGCERKHYGHGLCSKHWKRWYKYGDLVGKRPAPQSGRLCSIEDCGQPHSRQGLCNRHYIRWRKHGDARTILTTYGTPPEQRFWALVDKTETCWLWTGTQVRGGYGQFWLDGHKLAHCYAYETTVGPIPEGLQLDHLCRVTRCVRPSHLEPVTASENVRRGLIARGRRLRT